MNNSIYIILLDTLYREHNYVYVRLNEFTCNFVVYCGVGGVGVCLYHIMCWSIHVIYGIDVDGDGAVV